MKIKFWGTRGSIPVNGKEFCKYGGNTSSVEILPSENISFILDAGSGIRNAGIDIIKRKEVEKIFIFLSHFHTDHIVGLPFFTPFYKENYSINIFGLPYIYNTIEKIVDLIIGPPFFTLTKENFKAKILFKNLSIGDVFNINGVIVSTIKVNHPDPTLGYKIIYKNQTIVYITDNELIQNNQLSLDNIEKVIREKHVDLIEFCKNADVLIHDTSYDIDDYNERIGWGHSNIYSAAMLGHLAKVKKLYLFHYDPSYDDNKIDTLLNKTQKFSKKINGRIECYASSDYMEVEI